MCDSKSTGRVNAMRRTPTVAAMALRVDDVRVVSTVTGAGSTGHTDERFALHATDLGIVWDDGDGGVLVAFGDSFGAGWGGSGAGPGHADWRANIVTRSTTADPLRDGLDLTEAVTDAPGHAREVLHREGAGEFTIIPTTGIAVDLTDGGPVGHERRALELPDGGPARQFLHYMSVARWFGPGRWRTNHGGIAVSDDGGETWVRSVGARWGNGPFGRRSFQMAAFAHDPTTPGRVLIWGTRNGRFGPASLARAPGLRLDDPSAWEYFTGSGWSRRRRDAATVVRAPVAELSVGWHHGLRRWLMLHLDEARAAIVLRDAAAPEGPWSDGVEVIAGRDVPAPYGGYLHPWTLDGPEVGFTLSQWGPYNVFLVRMTLAA